MTKAEFDAKVAGVIEDLTDDFVGMRAQFYLDNARHGSNNDKGDLVMPGYWTPAMMRYEMNIQIHAYTKQIEERAHQIDACKSQSISDEKKKLWESNWVERVNLAHESHPEGNYSAFSDGKRGRGLTPALALEALERAMVSK